MLRPRPSRCYYPDSACFLTTSGPRWGTLLRPRNGVATSGGRGCVLWEHCPGTNRRAA
ncbi:hypothetical protein BCONGLO52_24350 [Brachybacterium conglomeratum]|uniref:Uncharacterized protein n=1 Tax=Brachybacterium conglomeratum TaxID=47846 RepID=A0ABQ5RI75_9MICO|nr:hypothetical protein BCONGLO52_24350 [Brachybacterium conglomeratum]GLK04507.1 hypothetical protein GCM10017597_13060 [Brachybacterium conglomeratum]